MIGTVMHNHELTNSELKITQRQRDALKALLLEGKLTSRQMQNHPSLTVTTNAELSGTHLVSQLTLSVALILSVC